MRQGFSLTELLAGLAITAIVASLSLPAIQHQYRLGQLTRLLDAVQLQFRRAQAVALAGGQHGYIAIHAGTSWCAVVTSTVCHCNIPASCSASALFEPVNSGGYPATSLVNNTFNPAHFARFSKGSGKASGNAGSLTFDVSGLRGKMIVSSQGRIRVCLENMDYGGYRAC